MCIPIITGRFEEPIIKIIRNPSLKELIKYMEENKLYLKGTGDGNVILEGDVIL